MAPRAPDRLKTKRYANLETPVPGQGIEPSEVPSKLSKVATELYDRQVRRVNDIAILEADTSIANNDTDLLHNPQSGALNRLGKDALAGYDDVLEDRRMFVDNVLNGLANDAQRDAVRARSMLTGGAFDSKLQVHQSKQTLLHENSVYQAALVSKKREVENAYDNPTELLRLIDESKQLIVRNATVNGKEAKWTKAAKESTVSDLHKIVIQQYLAKGDDQAAEDYYKKHDKVIFEDAALQTRMGEASTDGEAARIAGSIWGELAPTDDDQAVHLDRMMQAARESTKDTDVLKSVKTLLNERKTVHDASVKERADANENLLWEAHGNGAPVEALYASEEFAALPGKNRGAFRKAVTNINSKTDELLKLEQEINRATLSDPANIAVLRDADLDSMLRNKELSALGYRTLQKLRDPKRQPNAMLAFKRIDDAKGKKIFSTDPEANAKAWAEASSMLHSYLEAHPEGDPAEFVDQIMKPIELRWMETFFSYLGSEAGTEAARTRREERLQKIIGKPRKMSPAKRGKRKQAVEYLQSKGQPTTEANIKYIEDRL